MQSNSVFTKVNPVYSMLLDASQTKPGTQNVQIQFPHTLQNTGNADDSYTFALTNPKTGPALINPRIVPDNGSNQPLLSYGGGTGTLEGAPAVPLAAVAPGNTVSFYKFWVVGTIPVNATLSGSVDVTVTSAKGAGSITNNDGWTATTASVLSNLTKTFTPAAGQPNATSTVRINYVNSNYKSGIVVITDLLPVGMDVAATPNYRWTGYSAGTITPNVSNAFVPWVGTVASPRVQVTVNTVGDRKEVKYYIEYIDANASGQISFDVVVSAAAGSVLVNTGNFNWNDGTGTAGLVCPAVDNACKSDSTAGATFTVQRTVGASIWNSAGPVATPQPSNKLEWHAAVAQGTTQVDIPMVIKNEGNMNDDFVVAIAANSFPAGTTFQLLDATTNAALPSGGVALAPGATANIKVRALLLPTAYTATGDPVPYDATVTVTSVVPAGQPNVIYITGGTDTGHAQLASIIAAAVDVTNNVQWQSGGTGHGEGAGPGASPVTINNVTGVNSSTFFLFINNRAAAGGPSDSYNLFAGDTAAASGFAAGHPFTVKFFTHDGTACTATEITRTSTITAGNYQQVCATVNFTNGTTTASGDYEFYFAARSANGFTNSADVKWDRIHVNEYRSVTFTPTPLTSAAAQGGSTIYNHVINNQGNVTESINIAAPVNTINTWTSSVTYFDGTNWVPATAAFNLPAGQSRNVRITVSAPSDASAANTTTTTMTYTVAATSLTAQVQDITTVSGYVSLNKYLYVTPVKVNGDGTRTCDTTTAPASLLEASWKQPTNVSGAEPVDPGGCIYYRIVAQNLGSTPITGVEITDQTQQYTSLCTAGSSVCTTPAPVCSGNVACTVNVDNSGLYPSLKVTYGTMNPNDKVTIYYVVKVAQ